MDIFLYLIGVMIIIPVFGGIVSEIEDKIVRTVCLALGGTLLFFGGLVGLFAML